MAQECYNLDATENSKGKSQTGANIAESITTQLQDVSHMKDLFSTFLFTVNPNVAMRIHYSFR